MRETDHDLAILRALIKRSNAGAGTFLRSSFEIPEKSLSAEQLVRKLDSISTVVLGTVTRDGRPRVAPVVAIFYRGSFCIPTVRTSLRARHIANTPDVSLSLYEGTDFAVIVHGTGHLIRPDDDAFDDLIQIQIDQHAGDVRTWGEPVFIGVRAELLYSFARYPETFPE